MFTISDAKMYMYYDAKITYQFISLLAAKFIISIIVKTNEKNTQKKKQKRIYR